MIRDGGRASGWRHLGAGIRLHGPLWAVEIVVLNAAFLLAFFVRYGGRIPPAYAGRLGLIAFALLTVSYSAASIAFRSYRSVWRYVTLSDMARLALAVGSATVIIALIEVILLSRDHPIPLSTLIIGAMLSYLSLTHLKIASRLRHSRSRPIDREPLIIIGAGAAGIALARQLENDSALHPAAFIDDDRRKVGRSLSGIPVAGTRTALNRVAAHHGARTVALAIPSASPATIGELSRAVSDSGLQLLLVPPLHEHVRKGKRLPLRQAGLEDLFGRSEIGIDMGQITAAFSGKRVLITGAAGSIGSELARQICRIGPQHLILLDNNETGLADLRDELAPTMESQIAVISITDGCAMERLFRQVLPDVVIHAAALKHVDIVEEQPVEAVRVNVLGTAHCMRAAEAAGTGLFVLISTDKAVDPVNVLGASKRIGERLITSSADGPTTMLAVRFGNVLGSRGSVIPRFERQLAEGGPITITHPEVHRYFMSIPEAVRLVLQAACTGQPGHIYVLDMGEQVSIVELASRLGRLRGVSIPADVPIVYTGLRPGERLREKLVDEMERASPTAHPNISELVGTNGATRAEWQEALDDLGRMVDRAEPATVRGRLLDLATAGAHTAPQ